MKKQLITQIIWCVIGCLLLVPLNAVLIEMYAAYFDIIKSRQPKSIWVIALAIVCAIAGVRFISRSAILTLVVGVLYFVGSAALFIGSIAYMVSKFKPEEPVPGDVIWMQVGIPMIMIVVAAYFFVTSNDLAEERASGLKPQDGKFLVEFWKDPLKTLAITSLVALHIAIPLGLSFDLLMWWEPGYYLLDFIMMGFGMFFLGNLFAWGLSHAFWSSVLRRFEPFEIGFKLRILGWIFVALNVTTVLFVLTTNVFSILTVRSDACSLTGFLVPNGRVILMASVGAPSVNNEYSGDLTVAWTTPSSTNSVHIREETYAGSGGYPSEHFLTEGETIIREVIRIPDGIGLPTDMIWKFLGQAVVFYDRNGPKHYEEWGPGGHIVTVPVAGQPFTSSGALHFQSFYLFSPFAEVTKWKETHRGIIWFWCFALAFLNYGCFIRTRIIPFM